MQILKMHIALLQAGKTITSSCSLHHISLVQQKPETVRTVRIWPPKAMESLQDALEATDWDALFKPYGEDIDGLTNCTLEYIG